MVVCAAVLDVTTAGVEVVNMVRYRAAASVCFVCLGGGSRSAYDQPRHILAQVVCSITLNSGSLTAEDWVLVDVVQLSTLFCASEQS